MLTASLLCRSPRIRDTAVVYKPFEVECFSNKTGKVQDNENTTFKAVDIRAILIPLMYKELAFL